MQEKYDACDQPKIDVKQQPVTQRPGSSPVNLFASWVSQNARDTAQTDNARNPAHSQPCPREMPIHRIAARGPEHRPRDNDDCQYADYIKEYGRNISLVNVASNGVRL